MASLGPFERPVGGDPLLSIFHDGNPLSSTRYPTVADSTHHPRSLDLFCSFANRTAASRNAGFAIVKPFTHSVLINTLSRFRQIPLYFIFKTPTHISNPQVHTYLGYHWRHRLDWITLPIHRLEFLLSPPVDQTRNRSTAFITSFTGIQVPTSTSLDSPLISQKDLPVPNNARLGRTSR